MLCLGDLLSSNNGTTATTVAAKQHKNVVAPRKMNADIKDKAGLARVAALAAELVRLQHVAGVAVALVPRAGHAPTQLRARAPRVARVQLRAVPPVPVQVVAGGAAAAQSGPIIISIDGMDQSEASIDTMDQ